MYPRLDPTRPRLNRWRFAVLATAAIVMVTGTACSRGAPDQEEPDFAIEEVLPPGLPALDPVPLDLQPAEEPGAGEPTPIPWDDGTQTGSGDGENPCPGVLADGLVVSPNPFRIISGNKGYIDIKNCGQQEMAWTASTVAWVSLGETEGTLASGAVFRLLFTVNTASLPTGAYSFALTVNNINVSVSGTKLGGLVAPGGLPTPSPVPSVGGIIAPGISPCAVRCITQALLSTLPGRADVSIDIRTNTPADIVVMVDAREPSTDNDGDPYYADPQVRVATDARRSQWTTVLSPLQADTRYHIVVVARDHLGGTSFETGTFRTSKAADQIAAGEPGGCAVACVSHAVLHPRPGSPTYDIEVRTHVPTTLQVLANGVAVAGTAGEFVTTWQTVLELAPGTQYEVALRATDEQGRTAQHVAVVQTPQAAHQNRVLVTFHSIDVHDDADNSGANVRGELTFRFEVNGDRLDGALDTGERKVHAPERVNLDDGDRDPGRSVIIEDAPDQLGIRVQAQERDAHGAPTDFCSGGDPFFPETSGRTVFGGCMELEWNTAEGSIDLHQDQGGGALPPCYGFGEGVSGDLCIALGTEGDDPTFVVLISIKFLD